MKFSSMAASIVASGSGTAVAVRRRLSHRRPAPQLLGNESLTDPTGWQLVTIDRTAHEITPDGQLPAPLAALSELIEVRLSAAPGQRGTEVGARNKLAGRSELSSWKGDDPSRQIRLALQRTKQLLEVGEVLLVEPQPSGRRRKPAGLLVGLMTDDPDQEGVV
jgi:hypothetical protein